MTVLETIKATATALGIAKEVNDYLEGVSTDGEADTNALLRCFNIVENELALDYLPLTCEESFETDTGVLYFSELSRGVVRLLKITDESGEELSFRLFPEYVKTQAGTITVRYTYAPKEKTFLDDSDFTLYASVRLFVYGMAAEFSLAKGLFEEAAVWDAKYKEAIAAAYRSRPCKKIRSRRWV